MLGASFTGVTEMVNDCVSARAPSLTCTVTSSCHGVAPPSPGNHSITPLLLSMVIPAGALVSVHARAGPSTSLAWTLYWYAAPSVAVVMADEVTTGASLTPATVTLTVIVSLASPSLTRTTKLSLPAKFAFGV